MDISNLEFNNIKQNIINELRQDNTFKDYNFEGSAISALVDALAYATIYMNTYANFSINESFLETAQLRSSVVANAKNIGYIPYQYKSATAKIKVEARQNANIQDGDFISENTIFFSNSGTISYQFVSKDKSFFKQDNLGIWYAEVDLVQGIYITETYIQNELNTTSFILNNSKIDTEFITVTVYPNENSNNGTLFSLAENIESIYPESKIYYLQESYNGNVEIYFGDGILGTKLLPYNKVEIKYLLSEGEECNGINAFSSSQINNISATNFIITTIDASNNGSSKESIESIKYNAPRFFQRQNRNVTVSDYENAILSKFGGWISSIKVWGGEENNPPRYGSVYIAVKPKINNTLSPLQKSEIIEYLNNYNMPCINIIINDPKIINFDTNIIIDYYSYKLNVNTSSLKILIEETLRNYYNTDVIKFSSFINYSKIISLISEIDGVESVLIEYILKQSLLPENDITRTYNINFCNPLQEKSLEIGPWYNNGSIVLQKITDDGQGNLLLNETETVGTINYDTGIVELNNYKFSSADFIINVKAKPRNNNVYTQHDYILDDELILISLNKLNTE